MIVDSAPIPYGAGLWERSEFSEGLCIFNESNFFKESPQADFERIPSSVSAILLLQNHAAASHPWRIRGGGKITFKLVNFHFLEFEILEKRPRVE